MPFANINGVRIHYHVKGSGVPVIFVHPPLLTGRSFTYQQVQLSFDYKVIIFDIRGHGESGPSKTPITYPLIAEDIKQLLDYLNVDQAYICGYSTGGSIALEAMLTYPDRFRGGILVSAMSEISDAVNRSRIWLASQLAKFKTSKLLTAAICWGNADMPQTYKNLYTSSIKGNSLNVHQYYRYCNFYNCTDRLHEIKSPVLLLYGEKDRSFSKYGHILHKYLPNSSLYFIRGVKHQIPTKKADAMNEYIHGWISRLENGKEDDDRLFHHPFPAAEKTDPGEELPHS